MFIFYVRAFKKKFALQSDRIVHVRLHGRHRDVRWNFTNSPYQLPLLLSSNCYFLTSFLPSSFKCYHKSSHRIPIVSDGYRYLCFYFFCFEFRSYFVDFLFDWFDFSFNFADLFRFSVLVMLHALDLGLIRCCCFWFFCSFSCPFPYLSVSFLF